MVNIVYFEIYWLVSVHNNKQSYSSQDTEESKQEVESIIKDQLITEYEFYNYIKGRLASQANALPVQWWGEIRHYLLIVTMGIDFNRKTYQ